MKLCRMSTRHHEAWWVQSPGARHVVLVMSKGDMSGIVQRQWRSLAPWYVVDGMEGDNESVYDESSTN